MHTRERWSLLHRDTGPPHPLLSYTQFFRGTMYQVLKFFIPTHFVWHLARLTVSTKISVQAAAS